MSKNQNIHGRKWGRGVRPWLLIPKYLCVAILLGGMFATMAILPLMPENGADARWLIVARIYDYCIIPAAAGAMLFGALLLLQHPVAFLRMRWVIVKLIAIAVAVPWGHAMLSWRLQPREYMVWEQVWIATVPFFAAFVVITILGRLKPRLGQKVGSN